jgi:hypothetical protein
MGDEADKEEQAKHGPAHRQARLLAGSRSPASFRSVSWAEYRHLTTCMVFGLSLSPPGGADGNKVIRDHRPGSFAVSMKTGRSRAW